MIHHSGTAYFGMLYCISCRDSEQIGKNSFGKSSATSYLGEKSNEHGFWPQGWHRSNVVYYVSCITYNLESKLSRWIHFRMIDWL